MIADAQGDADRSGCPQSEIGMGPVIGGAKIIAVVEEAVIELLRIDDHAVFKGHGKAMRLTHMVGSSENQSCRAGQIVSDIARMFLNSGDQHLCAVAFVTCDMETL